MDEVETRIEGLARPIATAHGCELVRAQFRRGKRTAVLTVYLDVLQPEPGEDDEARAAKPFDSASEPVPAPYSGSPVSVDTCAKVSIELGSAIDAEDLVHGRYVLEVSSPGLERPLVRWKDYVRFRGHPVDVRVSTDGGGTRRVRGVLSGVRRDAMALAPDPGEPAEGVFGEGCWVPFERVMSTRLRYLAAAAAKPGGRNKRGRGAG